MEDLIKFKNKIFISGILIMLIAEVVSIPIIGFNWKFSVGLVLGTAISIANFNIMTISSIMILKGRNKFIASASFIIRLLLYGGVFYVSMRVSYAAGFASVVGFMTLKLAMFFVYGILPFFKKEDKKKDKLRKVKQQTLINDPYKIGYVGGRRIMTYKRFVEYKR